METYKYMCDGGSILIGNETFGCMYMNDYGDGSFNVTVYDKGEFKENHKKHNLVGCFVGKANLYDYDAYDSKQRRNSINVLCQLNGRYGIFAEKDSGNMHIEYWDDYNV